MESILRKYWYLPIILMTVLSCEKQGSAGEFIPALEIKAVTDSSINVTVNVNRETDYDYYYCSVMKVEEYEAMGGDEAVLAWGEQYITELRKDLRHGQQDIKISRLDPEKDYYVYAFQLTREGISGEKVIKQKVTTESRAFNAKITVDAELSYVIYISLEIEDPSDLYYVSTMKTEEYEAGEKNLAFVQDFFDSKVDSFIDLDNGINRETVLKSILMTGDITEGSIMYLTPDTDYTVILMRVKEDGTVTGFVTEEALTDVVLTADGSVSFTHDKYYDASYLGFPGMAAMPMDVSTEVGLISSIYSSYRGDYTSESEYPDYLVYSMVIGNSSSIVDTPYIVFILPWDMDITIMGFGMDSDRKLSKVSRTKVHLTKAGASDIKDYLVPDDAKMSIVSDKPAMSPEFVSGNHMLQPIQR